MRIKLFSLMIVFVMCGVTVACMPESTMPPTLTPPTRSPAQLTTAPSRNILTHALSLDDYQFVIECSGEGSPVVLLLGGRAAAWKPVQEQISRMTRTCIFDHKGSSPTPLTALHIAENVHTLLKGAGIPAPYVLVGFSVGGYITRLFRDLNTEEVAGIVLIDSSHQDQNKRFLAALPPAAAGECLELTDYRSALQGDHILPVGPEITLDFDASATEVREIVSGLGKIPLVVLTAGQSDWPGCFPLEVQQQLDQAWLDMQNELASLSTHSSHIVAEQSSHGFSEQPDIVIDAVRQVVDLVRKG